jgi:hypothetical protein
MNSAALIFVAVPAIVSAVSAQGAEEPYKFEFNRELFFETQFRHDDGFEIPAGPTSCSVNTYTQAHSLPANSDQDQDDEFVRAQIPQTAVNVWIWEHELRGGQPNYRINDWPNVDLSGNRHMSLGHGGYNPATGLFFLDARFDVHAVGVFSNPEPK